MDGRADSQTCAQRGKEDGCCIRKRRGRVWGDTRVRASCICPGECGSGTDILSAHDIVNKVTFGRDCADCKKNGYQQAVLAAWQEPSDLNMSFPERDTYELQPTCTESVLPETQNHSDFVEVIQSLISRDLSCFTWLTDAALTARRSCRPLSSNTSHVARTLRQHRGRLHRSLGSG